MFMEAKVKCWGTGWNNDTKRFESIQECTIKCKNCGHSVLFERNNKKELCNHCNKYVFRNDKEEFTYRLKERLLRR